MHNTHSVSFVCGEMFHFLSYEVQIDDTYSSCYYSRALLQKSKDEGQNSFVPEKGMVKVMEGWYGGTYSLKAARGATGGIVSMRHSVSRSGEGELP